MLGINRATDHRYRQGSRLTSAEARMLSVLGPHPHQDVVAGVEHRTGESPPSRHRKSGIDSIHLTVSKLHQHLSGVGVLQDHPRVEEPVSTRPSTYLIIISN